MSGLIEVNLDQNGGVRSISADEAPGSVYCSAGAEVVPVMDVAEVVELEQRIAQEGTSLYTLMTRAGKAVADAVRQYASVGSRVVILAGSGNNGGDGWVVAEDLAKQGYEVVLFTQVPTDEIKAEPAKAAALKAEATGSFRIEVVPELAAVERELQCADVVVDAILGTGFSHSEVREPYAGWINLANKTRDGEGEGEGESKDEDEGESESKGAWLIAVDCPSGLNAQTGIPAQACICADETVTMLAVKTGLLAFEAAPYVGQLRLALLDE